MRGSGFGTQIRELNFPLNIAIVSETEVVQNQRSEFLTIAKYLTLMGTPLIFIALAILFFTKPKHVAKSSKIKILSH